MISQKLPPCFNSKMVRLKALYTNTVGNYNTGFNSKMVRLKGLLDMLEHTDLVKFQFQNGAVKSLYLLLPVSNRSCFNSKMVRLKGDGGKIP